MALASVRIADLGRHLGEEVVLRGWLHNKRSSGKLKFLTVRDGSGFAQAVVARAAVEDAAWEAADHAGQESSLELTGKVKEDKRAPGGFEIDATGLRVFQVVHDYPITPKEHGTAFLMENCVWVVSARDRDP